MWMSSLKAHIIVRRTHRAKDAFCIRHLPGVVFFGRRRRQVCGCDSYKTAGAKFRAQRGSFRSRKGLVRHSERSLYSVPPLVSGVSIVLEGFS